MIKMLVKPLGHLKTLAKKTRQKAQTYLSKRPHRSFKKSKIGRAKIGGTKLPSVFRQLAETGKFLRQEKWLLVKLGLIYAITSYLFVGGVSQLDFIGFKDSTLQFLGGDVDSLGNATALFLSAVMGTLAAPTNELQQFLSIFIGFLFWLAVVWAARMRLAGNKVKARDALYNSGTPLISSVVLVSIIVLQLIPAAVAIFLFAILQTGGLLQGGVEIMMFSLGALLLFLLSSYWLSASLLSLVVVTLPGMYPWKALSAASELIVGQRWAVALRLAVLGVMICVFWGILLLPSILLDGWLRWDWLPIVPIVVQLLGALSLVYSSAYIYKLYRSLL